MAHHNNEYLIRKYEEEKKMNQRGWPRSIQIFNAIPPGSGLVVIVRFELHFLLRAFLHNKA